MIGRLRPGLRLHRRDERGAILVLSTVGFVLAVLAAALSVDIGRQTLSERDIQRAADLAAMDTVRLLDQPATVTQAMADAVATESLGRNGYDPADTAKQHVLSVEVGRYDSATRTFTPSLALPDAGANAVRVTTRELVDYFFGTGSRVVTRSGVAMVGATAVASIGSSLATFDASASTVMNQVLSQFFRTRSYRPPVTPPAPPDVNLDAVSYNGLANTTVTLGELAGALNVGSPDQVLDAGPFTAGQLFVAYAQALTNRGPDPNDPNSAPTIASINALNAIQQSASGSGTLKLGDVVRLSQGSGQTAAETGVNLLQLAAATAQVSNGNTFVSVPGATLGIPGAASVRLDFGLIEPAKTWRGPTGTSSPPTQQVSLTVTPTVNTSFQLGPLLPVYSITGQLPVAVAAAQSTGTIGPISCDTSPRSVIVEATNAAWNVSTSATLSITAVGLPVPLQLPVSGATSSGGGNAGAAPFNYTTEFMPPVGTGTAKPVGGNTLGLSGGFLQLVPPSGSTILNGALSALQTQVLAPLDTAVFGPVFKALGVQVASADVAAHDMTCGQPALVK